MTDLEFSNRLTSLVNEATDVKLAVCSMILVTAVLGIIDRAKLSISMVESTTEEEFLDFCKKTYRKVRSVSSSRMS